MANVFDYIKHYKEYTLDEIPFNDLDSLILTQLAYINFNDNVAKSSKEAVSIDRLSEHFGDRKRGIFFNTDSLLMRNSVKLLEHLKYTRRFSAIKAYGYVKIINDETQFSALSFLLPDKTIFISFEGTDSSIIGWKEDFNLMYQFPIPAQIRAIDYVNNTIGLFDSKVILGGHSKGGNLAIASAMYCKKYIKKKIVSVYSFDGPGFLKKEFESKEYQEMSKKLKMIVPSECFVGMLLYQPKNQIVVKSKYHGLLQHDIYNWECFGSVFIKDNLSKRSEKNHEKILEFLDEMTLIERHDFVNTIFLVFEKADITDTEDIKITKLNKSLSLLREIQNIDKETKNKIIIFIKMLISDI